MHDVHEHGHPDHRGAGHGRAFALGTLLNTGFVGLEIYWGIMASSSALLADAGHNAGDVLGLILAWGAAILAARRPRGRHTYGWRRATILASLLNGMLLLGAVVLIARDALVHLAHPRPVSGTPVMVVAGIGFFINALTALLFLRGGRRDLNIRGAFLHMAADAGVSLGVVLAGLVIRLTGWFWVDPLASLLVVLVILFGTWGLLVESLNLALDAAPRGIDPGEVRKVLMAQEGVAAVHDLHVWALSTTRVSLTAHLVMPGGGGERVLPQLRRVLQERFDIDHTTFQVEPYAQEDRACPQDAPCCNDNGSEGC